MNYDCTYFDESIFTMEEYFNRKNNIFHPRSWNIRRIQSIVDDKDKPAPLNRNLFYSDCVGKLNFIIF